MTNQHAFIVPALVLIAIGSLAKAQDSQPLSGPRVTYSDQTSIAEPGFSGMGQMPQERKEIAALRLLDLDEPTQAAADAILIEHSAALDAALLEHIVDLNAWTIALRTGSPAERMEALGAVNRALAPVRALGPLDQRLRAVLPEEQRTTFDRLLAEHEATLEQQARREAEAQGVRFAPAQHRIRRHYEEIGLDVRASYERTIVSQSDDFDQWLTSAQLSPEGEALVRNAVLDLIQRTELRPTAAQRRQTIVGVLAKLSPEDRRRMLEALRDR